MAVICEVSMMNQKDFFRDVGQAEIDLDGDLVKLPIFYRDGEAITGVFPARLGQLKKILPDRRLTPARVAPGVGAVTITCFEYRESDVGTYNELAIGFVLAPPGARPGFPMQHLLGGVRRGQLEAYVHHLPVTTDIALRSGRQLWNFPKTVHPIEFEEDSRNRTCTLKDGGAEVLSLTVPKLASPRREQIQLFSNVYQDGQPQRCEFKLQAQRSARTIRRGAAKLKLGDAHPIARELRKLLLSTDSIAASYVPSMIGILYGPQNISARMIQLAAGSGGAAETQIQPPRRGRRSKDAKTAVAA